MNIAQMQIFNNNFLDLLTQLEADATVDKSLIKKCKDVILALNENLLSAPSGDGRINLILGKEWTKFGKELNTISISALQIINEMPQYCRVGLITFAGLWMAYICQILCCLMVISMVLLIASIYTSPGDAQALRITAGVLFAVPFVSGVISCVVTCVSCLIPRQLSDIDPDNQEKEIQRELQNFFQNPLYTVKEDACKNKPPHIYKSKDKDIKKGFLTRSFTFFEGLNEKISTANQKFTDSMSRPDVYEEKTLLHEL